MTINLQEEYMDACESVHRLSLKIMEQKDLLTRAADALEIWIAQADYITATIPEQKLIAELRKAAQQ